MARSAHRGVDDVVMRFNTIPEALEETVGNFGGGQHLLNLVWLFQYSYYGPIGNQSQALSKCFLSTSLNSKSYLN